MSLSNTSCRNAYWKEDAYYRDGWRQDQTSLLQGGPQGWNFANLFLIIIVNITPKPQGPGSVLKKFRLKKNTHRQAQGEPFREVDMQYFVYFVFTLFCFCDGILSSFIQRMLASSTDPFGKKKKFTRQWGVGTQEEDWFERDVLQLVKFGIGASYFSPLPLGRRQVRERGQGVEGRGDMKQV